MIKNDECKFANWVVKTRSTIFIITEMTIGSCVGRENFPDLPYYSREIPNSPIKFFFLSRTIKTVLLGNDLQL